MIIIKHSIKTSATPEAVWKLWSAVENWPQWDHGIEAAALEGPFEKGTKGWLKPIGGPKVKFEILSAQKNVGFHDRSFLPLTRLDFKHSITQVNGETVVTHEVEMKGLFSFIFSRVVGSNIKKDMPSAMQKLIDLAETKK